MMMMMTTSDDNSFIKAGLNVKAVLTSLNTAFLPISRSRFKQRVNLYAYFVNHCLVVLCKFLGDF